MENDSAFGSVQNEQFLTLDMKLSDDLEYRKFHDFNRFQHSQVSPGEW